MEKKGFTLAEVLITIAIIGVVAALTIPSVIVSYKDQQYNTARLKALKTFGEAGKMASINGEINGQPTAKDFVNKILSKYLKITKMCDNDKATECNFPEAIQPLKAESEPIPSDNLKAWQNINSYCGTYNNWTDRSNTDLSVYLETVDGFSAKIFYNPNCIRSAYEDYSNNCASRGCEHRSFDAACIDVIYDMNGIKGPNHVGEDIGIVTTFWSGLNATSVAPGILPYPINADENDARGKLFTEVAQYCINKGTAKKAYSLPSVEEASSIAMHKDLISLDPFWDYWSGSVVTNRPGYAWRWDGVCQISNNAMQNTGRALCVRR